MRHQLLGLWRIAAGAELLSSLWLSGVKYINGYDDPEIVAGAGTIGEAKTWSYEECLSLSLTSPPRFCPTSDLVLAALTRSCWFDFWLSSIVLKDPLT
jgi:hypothetical protein